MNRGSKSFLVMIALSLGFAFVGVIAMTIMEEQARWALPAEMRTPKAIQDQYDGAVCLACDIYRSLFALFGFGFAGIISLLWVVYEAVTRGIKASRLK